MRQADKAGEVEEWRYGHVLYFLFQLTLVFLGAISVGHSQGAKGGITGSLLDSSGAYVVGATVSATNLDAGLTRSTVSKSDGVFLVPLLDAGRYRVEVVAQGVKKPVCEPVVAVVTETANLANVELAARNVIETVTVTGQAALLQTESPTTGNVFMNLGLRWNYLDLDMTFKLGSSNVGISVYDAPDQLVRTKAFPQRVCNYSVPQRETRSLVGGHGRSSD